MTPYSELDIWSNAVLAPKSKVRADLPFLPHFPYLCGHVFSKLLNRRRNFCTTFLRAAFNESLLLALGGSL